VHLAFLVDGRVDMPVLDSEGRNLHRPARQIKTRIGKLDLVEDQDRVRSIGGNEPQSSQISRNAIYGQIGLALLVIKPITRCEADLVCRLLLEKKKTY